MGGTAEFSSDVEASGSTGKVTGVVEALEVANAMATASNKGDILKTIRGNT